MTVLLGVSAYVPRSRIAASTIAEAWDGFRARGVEEKRVAGADEDTVTMAVAAAQRAIADADVDRAAIGTLALGTTTPPVDEGDVGVTVSEILGLEASVDVRTATQSTRAGTRALRTAVESTGTAVAVASDAPLGAPDDAVDHAAGAGAVAVVAGDGEVPTDSVEGDRPTVTGTATYGREYPGTRFRRRGAETVETYGAAAYEREAYTSTLAGAYAALSDPPTDVAPTAPDGSLPGRAGRAIDGATVHHLADELGDTGAASPLFGLLAAWEAGADSVAVLGYGDGAGVDAVAIEGTRSVEWRRPASDLTYAEYLRTRGHVLPSGGDR
ncbi:hypothetical protein [Halobaculum lipolyticum]|uniref:Hydroxymethylglutaryl-CoA synthase n=1 Tax=Halobaculum lipolyticum TaxID=3032001 RepID=A0ABD5WAG3_9EURY|nr:hypothetical protein [Halobaculum sp. DT31]